MSERTGALTGGVLLSLWLLGKGLAFAKDLLVSYYFGASSLTDAYFVASNVPSLVYAGLYATVPLVLLPQYSQQLAAGGIAVANRFVSATMNVYSLTALLLSAVVYGFANELVYLLAPALDASTAQLAVSLTRIFAVTFLFSMVSAVLTTVQLAHGHVAGTQLIPIVNNSVFIIGVYFFARTVGIYAAAIAATAAWVIQTPLQWLLVRAKFTYAPRAILSRSEIARLLTVLAPALLSVSIENLNVLVSIFFGSRLSEGSISALSYATRLQNLCTGVFLVFTTSLLYPALSRKAASTIDGRDFQDYLANATKSLILVVVPMAVVLAVFSHEVVEVVFQRGAFRAESTLTTAAILLVLAIAIPFVAVRDLFLRAIYALQLPAYAVAVSLSGLVCNVAMSYLLVDVFGTTGLAVALLASSLVSCLICFSAYLYLKGTSILRGLLSASVRLTLITVLVVWITLEASLKTLIPSTLARLVIGGGLILGAFALGYFGLRLVSTRNLVQALGNRNPDR